MVFLFFHVKAILVDDPKVSVQGIVCVRFLLHAEQRFQICSCIGCKKHFTNIQEVVLYIDMSQKPTCQSNVSRMLSFLSGHCIFN